MAKMLALTERPIAQRFGEVKDEEATWGDISEEGCLLAKRIIKGSLEEGLSMRLGVTRSVNDESEEEAVSIGCPRSLEPSERYADAPDR
jgi:hypothetical protein